MDARIDNDAVVDALPPESGRDDDDSAPLPRLEDDDSAATSRPDDDDSAGELRAEDGGAAEAATGDDDSAALVAADELPFDGKVDGGWGYVGAAYGISLFVLLVYVLVTTVRLRGLESRHGRS